MKEKVHFDKGNFVRKGSLNSFKKEVSEDLLNISSDMYILSLTDMYNCFFTDTIVVFEPDQLVADLSFGVYPWRDCADGHSMEGNPNH